MRPAKRAKWSWMRRERRENASRRAAQERGFSSEGLQGLANEVAETFTGAVGGKSGDRESASSVAKSSDQLPRQPKRLRCRPELRQPDKETRHQPES